jgi:hypothetical protein
MQDPFVSLMHFTAQSATQVRRKSMRVPHLNFKILAKPFRQPDAQDFGLANR